MGMNGMSIPQSRMAVASGVILNCLIAGSAQLFPLVAIPLARRLHLSSTQTAIMATGTTLGMYGSATFVGSLADRGGPGVVSWLASGLFGVSYGVLGWRYSVLAVEGEERSEYEWLLFVGLYVCVGVGVTASYFAAIIASTKSLPQRHSGLAIGVPSSLFGLSPLFLSPFASFFTSPKTHELDPGQWFYFLAVFFGIVNLIGGFTLNVIPWEEETLISPESGGPTERTALLANEDVAESPQAPPNDVEESQSLKVLFSNPTFWIFWFVMALSLGPCEMIIASLGTIVESMLGIHITTPTPDGRALGIRKLHIQIISVANTFSRLLAGALSDWLSYSSSLPPSSVTTSLSSSSVLNFFSRPPKVSRLTFILSSTLLLSLSFLYSLFSLTQVSQLYILTTTIGISYGTLFTLCPAIVRSVYPVKDFGRNFGLMSWASAGGAMVFTPLFGWMVDREAKRQESEICYGRECWKEIFWWSFASTVLASLLVVFLWRKWWRGKV